MQRRGVEQHGRPQAASNQPGGLLLSARVPRVRNVYGDRQPLMAPSSGLGSFFILRRRGVEQHGRPTVRTMIWTNNPYSKVRHRLPSTETMAGLYFLTTFRSSETPGKPCCGLLFLTTIPTTNHPAKADSIWQYPINADNKKSTKYRFFIDIPWILLGAREGI